MTKEELMHRAIELSKNSVKTGGGPFGAVIAKDGIIIAEASNLSLIHISCPHQLETELSYTRPAAGRRAHLLMEHRMIFLPSKFCKEPNVSDKINANEMCIRDSSTKRSATRLHAIL